MSGFLAFHLIAAARGDGLHPRLREMLEQRARIEAATDIVDLGVLNGSVQAGPNPAPTQTMFRPGNVVAFGARSSAAAAETTRKAAK